MPTPNRWQQLVTTLYGGRMGLNPDNELVVGGNVVATQARDADGNITGLAGAGGKVYSVEYAEVLQTLTHEKGDITHTRASANASVIDSNGTMQFCLSGELRFLNARRVCNMIADSEGLSTGWTLGANTTKAALNVRSPNHSRDSAWTVTRSSGAATMLTLDAASYRPGQWTFSAWLRGDGVEVLTIAIGATTQTVTPAAGVWTRVAVLADITTTATVAATITNTTSGNKNFGICDPQFEWTEGAAGAPNDYVPRGVTNFPAALLTADADGVRYFNTVNPWSLSSGVATQSAVVTHLNPDSLGGAFVEPGTTNQVYSSRSAAATEWAKSGSTVVNATPIDSVVLGTNSLYKIEEIAATSGWRVTQSWRGTNPSENARISTSAIVKAGERSIFYLGIRQLDGSTVLNAYYNTVTGLTSVITSGCTAYMRALGGGEWLISLTGSAGATGSTAPLMQVGVTSSAGSASTAGTLGFGGYVGAMQFENNGVSTSYAGDTTSAASLTRAADLASITTTLIPGIDFTIEVDYSPQFPTDTPQKDDWWYAVYSYVSQSDRCGFGMRPASFGGFTDGRSDEWFFDLYPNITPAATSWDGVEVVSNCSYNPGETIKLQWSVANTAQNGASNQSGYVGANAAALTSDSPRAAVNTIPGASRTWYLGRQGANQNQRGPAGFKNLRFYSPAATTAEMAVEGNE